MIDSATCEKIVYHCSDCGFTFTKEGTFSEYHDYKDGKCKHCGAKDPDYEEPKTEPDDETSKDSDTDSSEETEPDQQSLEEDTGDEPPEDDE